MDTISTREAYVAKNENSNKTYNRRVTVKLHGVLPNMIVPDLSTISYIEKKTGTATNNKNTLLEIDENGNATDRFKYIATALSPITDQKAEFYYDDTYKDIIVIPDLDSLGAGDTATLYSNRNVSIDGYKVLGQGNYNQYSTQLTLPTITDREDSGNFLLSDKPNKINTTNTYLLYIDGLQPNSKINQLGHTYQNGDIGYNMYRVPIILVDLGKVSDIFGKQIRIPTFNTLYKGLNQHVLDYLGCIDSDRLIIPLSF